MCHRSLLECISCHTDPVQKNHTLKAYISLCCFWQEPILHPLDADIQLCEKNFIPVWTEIAWALFQYDFFLFLKNIYPLTLGLSYALRVSDTVNTTLPRLCLHFISIYFNKIPHWNKMHLGNVGFYYLTLWILSVPQKASSDFLKEKGICPRNQTTLEEIKSTIAIFCIFSPTRESKRNCYELFSDPLICLLTKMLHCFFSLGCNRKKRHNPASRGTLGPNSTPSKQMLMIHLLKNYIYA